MYQSRNCGSVRDQFGASCLRLRSMERQPICSRIQRSRNWPAVTHRSRSVELPPEPFNVEQCFLQHHQSSMISTLKRRDVWNRRSSTLPKEISRNGRSKIGSQTARIAASNSSARVSAGAKASPTARHQSVQNQ